MRPMERLLMLWDEVDDWLTVALQLLGAPR
jgi:hypothetical protein